MDEGVFGTGTWAAVMLEDAGSGPFMPTPPPDNQPPGAVLWCAVVCRAMLCRALVRCAVGCCGVQGMLGITLVNLIPGVKPTVDHTPPAGMDATRGVFWASMYFTALGGWDWWGTWDFLGWGFSPSPYTLTPNPWVGSGGGKHLGTGGWAGGLMEWVHACMQWGPGS